MTIPSRPVEDFLRTEHLLPNLGKRASSGGFVTGTAQMAKFAINFASAAVLARLLNPSEFGLVGMVLAVTSLLGLFKDLGLSTATVQREYVTQQQVSNLFWTNVGLSGFLTLAGVALAPVLAWFYRDPRVTGIMLAISISFLLSGSTVQHQALLTRQMRFRSLAVIDVTSTLLGFATACYMAKLGYSYWALVAQQVCMAGSSLVLTWIASGWRPMLPSRGSGVRPMLRFGANLTFADLIGRTAMNTDSILVGRFFGAVPLGLYSRASVLLARPSQQILAPITSVVIPVLSRLQSDPQRYRRTFLRAFDMLALIMFPFAAMCLVLAKPMVLVVLGAKWLPVVPLFGGFTLVAISMPLSVLSSWLFMSQGRGRDLLHTYSIAGALTVVSFAAGLPWGPLGVVLSYAIFSFAVRLPILYHLGGRRGPVSTGDLWTAFLSFLPCWAAVYLTTTLAHNMVLNASPWVQLLFCGPAGLIAGMCLAMIFRRPRESAIDLWWTVGKFVRQRQAA